MEPAEGRGPGGGGDLISSEGALQRLLSTFCLFLTPPSIAMSGTSCVLVHGTDLGVGVARCLLLPKMRAPPGCGSPYRSQPRSLFT